jgi:hypothetical protein
VVNLVKSEQVQYNRLECIQKFRYSSNGSYSFPLTTAWNIFKKIPVLGTNVVHTGRDSPRTIRRILRNLGTLAWYSRLHLWYE